jgi:hypothetical protein
LTEPPKRAADIAKAITLRGSKQEKAKEHVQELLEPPGTAAHQGGPRRHLSKWKKLRTLCANCLRMNLEADPPKPKIKQQIVLVHCLTAAPGAAMAAVA